MKLSVESDNVVTIQYAFMENAALSESDWNGIRAQRERVAPLEDSIILPK